MFKLKKSWLLVFTAVLLAVFAVGCPAAEEEQGEEGAFEGQVKIGIMVPTTGAQAEPGLDMENAIKLAVSEINAAGGLLGHEIITVTGDDGCDPAMATAAASKLVAEEVVAVVGGFCSGATLPTLKIYGEASIPFTIAASNATTLIDEIAATGGWAFMINSTGDQQATKAVEQFEALGAETIALIDDGSAFARDLSAQTKTQWEAAGNQVTSEETVVPGMLDFSSLVTSIVATNPDGIYWTGYHSEGGPLVRQLREGGYEGVIMVGDGSSSVETLTLAGPLSEGIFCTAPPKVEFLPAAAAFIDSYEAMFPRPPGAYAGLAYDAMMLMADAIERAGSFDGAAIKEALSATADFEGLAGAITFTERNTLARSNFVILEGQNLSWVPVQ